LYVILKFDPSLTSGSRDILCQKCRNGYFQNVSPTVFVATKLITDYEFKVSFLYYSEPFRFRSAFLHEVLTSLAQTAVWCDIL